MEMKRKAHVKRLYQSDAEGNVTDRDIFIDVMRLDQFPVTFRGFPSSETHEGALWVFQWKDTAAENHNPVRKTDYRLIHNPDDPGQTMRVWIADVWEVSERAGGPTNKIVSAFAGGSRLTRWWFANNVPLSGDPGVQGAKPRNQARIAQPLKIVNNDLGGLDMTGGTVGWDTYKQALIGGNRDPSQRLFVELPLGFTVTIGADPDTGSLKQNLQVLLTLNKTEVAPLFEAAAEPYGGGGLTKFRPGSGLSDGGFPLVRLDPLQAIVNVGWGGGLAVEFYPKGA